MMIQCTERLLNKLQDYVPLAGVHQLMARDKIPALETDFKVWTADIVPFDKAHSSVDDTKAIPFYKNVRNSVILINNATLIPAIILHPLKKDFADFGNVLVNAIAESLFFHGINELDVAAYASDRYYFTNITSQSRQQYLDQMGTRLQYTAADIVKDSGGDQDRIKQLFLGTWNSEAVDFGGIEPEFIGTHFVKVLPELNLRQERTIQYIMQMNKDLRC